MNDAATGPGLGERIRDFTGSDPVTGQSHDLIDVFAIDAKANSVGNNAFSFIGTDAFTAEGQIRYSTNGAGNTVVEFNTDNTHAGSEMTITLNGVVPLIDADFVL